LKATKQNTSYKFLGVQELAFITFGGLFFQILDPSTLGGRNFLNFNLFLTIFNAPDAPIGRV
jgi:hypothetical protein